MEIDFTARKTERDWSDVYGSFASALGDQLLKLVEWVIVVAGLAIAESKTSSGYLTGLKVAALMGLFLYLQGFFMRLDVKMFPRPVSKRQWWIELIMTMILSVLPFLGIWYLARAAAASVAASGAL